MNVTPNDGKLTLSFNDCKTRGENYPLNYIIGVEATVIVPDGLHITSTQSSILCYPPHHIAWKGNKYTTIALMFFSFYYCRKMWDHIMHAI